MCYRRDNSSNNSLNLLLNLRSPRDYVVRSSIRPSFVRACGMC